MNKKSVSFTISIVFNFLLMILVCVAGLSIESQKRSLETSDYLLRKSVNYSEELQYWLDVRDETIEYLLAFEEIDERHIERLNSYIDELRDNPIVKEVPVEVEKIVYVARVVTENVTIDTRDFESAEELLAWLESDNLDSLTQVRGIFECEEFADALKRRAKEAGFTIDRQYYSSGTKLPMSDRVLKKAHVMNSTVIDNDVWLIEPMTDEAWQAYKRDSDVE